MFLDSQAICTKTGAQEFSFTAYDGGPAPAPFGQDVVRSLHSALFLLREDHAQPLNPAAGRLVAVLAAGGPLARAIAAAAAGKDPLDYYGPSGDAAYVLARGQPFEQDGVGGVLVEIVDAGAAFAVETGLRREIGTDSLTGVASRQRFFAEAGRMLAEARRHRHGFSLLMLDLDRFKAINDRHGHGVGDRVLVEACRTWSSALRRDDLIGRLGGEEFAVLLSHTRRPGACRAAERLCRKLEPLQGRLALHDPVTVSVGVAVLRPDDSGAEGLLRRADAALYAAKAGGRNRTALHEGDTVLSCLSA